MSSFAARLRCGYRQLRGLMTVTQTSTCRLCTAMCPIVVTIEDGRAVEVHGDREAPLYEGYTCPKGRALPEVHANPKRLLHSLRRRPSFEDADAFLFAGTNPVISKQFLAENPAKRLSRAVERGAKIIVIDPRRTETARRAHVHLQPRPGQDAAVMAGLIHVILRER